MSFEDLLAVGDEAVLDHLGCPVSYVSTDGVEKLVAGIFDRAYVRVDVGQPGVSSSGPAVFLRVADLPVDPETDLDPTIVVEGVSYRVREVEPDGKGGVVITLSKLRS